MTDHVMCYVIFSRMNRGMTERDLQIVTYNPNYTIPEKGRPDSNWFFFSFKHIYSIFPEPMFLLDISGYKCKKSVNSGHHFEVFWKALASVDFLEEKTESVFEWLRLVFGKQSTFRTNGKWNGRRSRSSGNWVRGRLEWSTRDLHRTLWKENRSSELPSRSDAHQSSIKLFQSGSFSQSVI